MNALWLTRICAYKNSPESIESAKRIIAVKIQRQEVLLRKYKKTFTAVGIEDARTLQEIFLEEARAAKLFWREFQSLLPANYAFQNRRPRTADTINRLLDIGYHYLLNTVKISLKEHGISPAIGLLHTARTAHSTPLAYDLMEMFRSDLVDAEVLRFVRLKKQNIETLEQKDIAQFLAKVKGRRERTYYLKDFNRCHTYRYYMEVQILKFIKAVNHGNVFEPLSLPVRHDTRCSRHALDTSPPSVLPIKYEQIMG